MARQLARATADVEHGQHPLGHEARCYGGVHIGCGPMATEHVAGRLEAAGLGVVVDGNGARGPAFAHTDAVYPKFAGITSPSPAQQRS